MEELLDVVGRDDRGLGEVFVEVGRVLAEDVRAVRRRLPGDDAAVVPLVCADVLAAGRLRGLAVVAVAEGPRLVPVAVPGRRGEGRKRVARGDSKGSEGSCWIFAGGRATRY